jgi:hypothetical protein
VVPRAPQQSDAAAVLLQQQQQFQQRYGVSFVVRPCDLTASQVAALVFAVKQQQSSGYIHTALLLSGSWANSEAQMACDSSAAKQALQAAKAQVLAEAAAALAAQQHPNTQLQQRYERHMQKQQKQLGSSFVIRPCELTPPQIAALVAAVRQQQRSAYIPTLYLSTAIWEQLECGTVPLSSAAKQALQAATDEVLSKAIAALAAQQHPDKQLQQRYERHVHKQQAISTASDSSEEPFIENMTGAANSSSTACATEEPQPPADVEHQPCAAGQQQQQQCSSFRIRPCDLTPPEVATLVAAIKQQHNLVQISAVAL